MMLSRVSTPVCVTEATPAAINNDAPPVGIAKQSAKALTPLPNAAPATPRHSSLPVSPAKALETNCAVAPIKIDATVIAIKALIPKHPVGSA